MRNTYFAKIIRNITAFLPVAKNRTGECKNCGACCRLPEPCIFLRENNDGTTYCRIYKIRPLSCRKYPRTEKEFLTKGICSFKFR